MIASDVTVRCLDCGRPVRPEGGAWCAAHRPVDLTRGVMPWDHASHRQGRAGLVRVAYGSVPATLLAAGWTKLEVGGRTRWCPPGGGAPVAQETARQRVAPTAQPAARGRRDETGDLASQWVDLVDGGVRYAEIAERYGVHVATVAEGVRRIRRERAA